MDGTFEVLFGSGVWLCRLDLNCASFWKSSFWRTIFGLYDSVAVFFASNKRVDTHQTGGVLFHGGRGICFFLYGIAQDNPY